MEKKKRKYEIQSSVQFPNMEEIQKAASDYSEESIGDVQEKTTNKSGRFPTVDTKPQFDAKLSSIKKEMQQLAVAIAKEEENKEVLSESGEEDSEASAVGDAAVMNPKGGQMGDKDEKRAKKAKKPTPKK